MKDCSDCTTEDLDEWSRVDWREVLTDPPQLFQHCQWDKLSGDEWSELLIKRPQLADKYDWDKLTEDNWVKLLDHYP